MNLSLSIPICKGDIRLFVLYCVRQWFSLREFDNKEWNYYFLHRNYKVQLVALSDNSFYSDSAFSNTLLVSTSPHSPRLLSGEDMVREDQDMIPVKVIAVTETSIQLDWSNFLETEGVAGYKIQWSSVAQPAVCIAFIRENWYWF